MGTLPTCLQLKESLQRSLCLLFLLLSTGDDVETTNQVGLDQPMKQEPWCWN